MRRYTLLVLLVMVALLVACTPAAPQIVEVPKEVIVEREKIVTVEVEKEVEVEKTIVETVIVETEKEVVVTATPVPATAVPVVPTEMQMGGTINVWLPNGWPEASWLHTSNWESAWATSPMREPLFFNLPDGTMEGFLAEDYEVSDDGLTYTVNLREGVLWHDGEPFTAEDVVYSYYMWYHPGKRPLAEIRYGRTIDGLLEYNAGERDDIPGIQAVDDLTVEFTLTAPDAGFPKLALNYYPASGPIPKHIIEPLDQAEHDRVMEGTADYWTTAPIGTGPYKFTTYATDQYIEFDRNDDYWGGPVGPDKMFLKIASPEVAIVLLQSGELDLMNPLQFTEAGRLAADPNLEVVEAKNSAQWYGLEMNYYTEDGLWREPKAKQALLMSIDRQAYVDSILQGFGVVRHSFFDGTAYACPTMKEYNYDPEAAEALWEEIGLTAERRAEIQIDFMSWLGLKARMDYLPIAQEYLRSMGFKSNVDIIDNALINDYRDGAGARGMDWDFHVLLFGPGADPGTGDSFLNPEANSNWGYRSWPEKPNPATGRKDNAWIYDNARINELVAMAQVETDPDLRMEYYQEVDCILNEELPFLMTAAPSFLVGKSARMQGLDWQKNAGLALWTVMYKPGDWWLWQE